MPSIEEGVGDTPLNAALDLGLETLSLQQEVLFTKYVRQVLPLDGYVFWIKSDLLSPAALKAAGTTRSGATVLVKGSLHFSTDDQQREDETLSLNRVVFTAEAPIDEFNRVSPNIMYLGTFVLDAGKLKCACQPGAPSTGPKPLRFSFNRRASLYRQAGLYHYQGDAVYPALATQIVDTANDLDLDSLIVSNSLPIWLSLNQFFTIYPSFLVDNNIIPPYAACHIGESDTSPIQALPYIAQDGSHYQLVKDRVRITLYGLTNDIALDWQDYVIAYMTNHDDVMGLMNMPIMRDAKRMQSEMNVIAMKKVIEFEVSYYQTRIRDLVRRLIIQAIPTIYIDPS